ncbi:MAG: PhzF family phenazine biosynthesis protein [Synechococcaceae cyanobacterium]|nr:PhzF family phenazine biosynthesis protein [Synechococcaceae cyanobacterium]
MSGGPEMAVLPAVLIEAFAEQPCHGNGAAVVLLERARPAPELQALAGSLKQSETAFLLPWGREWLLRWFTPACEVPLCGHATLAAVIALGHWGRLAAGAATRFHTRSGPLPVELEEGAARGRLALPGGDLRPRPVPPALQTLLRQRLGHGAERFWGSGLGYHVALLPTQAPLPEPAGLAAELPPEVRAGLVLMQALPAADPADYRLRFFAPGLGIDEDPVTGSAHALVAPWWMERLGRPRVVGWQCSDRPGGMVCEAASSGMIRLSGWGYLLWDGVLQLPLRSGWAGAGTDSGSASLPSPDDPGDWFDGPPLP